MTVSKAIEKVLSIAAAEVGYLEKADNKSLDDKTANAGSANYTKYWKEIKPEYQAQPWCAAFVTWVFVQAFGKDMAEKLLKHYPFVYCPTMANLFTLNSNPRVGDIVIFKRNGVFAHTGIVSYVKGDYFETYEGNTSSGSTIVPNGGGVHKKSYYNSNLPGTKFCTPDWELVVAESENVDMEELKKQMEALTERVDELSQSKMIYNYIDENMPEWAREGVQWCVDNDIIKGTGEGLGLDDRDLRYCTMLMRLGKIN